MGVDPQFQGIENWITASPMPRPPRDTWEGNPLYQSAHAALLERWKTSPERMAEWLTEGLRALYLEAAGYRVKILEFISTEHTAKNLMIAGVRVRGPGHVDDAQAQRIRKFAAFYGIKTQALARHLGFELRAPDATTGGHP